MRVYLRDGSAQTILRVSRRNSTSHSTAAQPVMVPTCNTSGSNSTSHSIAAQPVLALTCNTNGGNSTSHRTAAQPVLALTCNTSGGNSTSHSTAAHPVPALTCNTSGPRRQAAGGTLLGVTQPVTVEIAPLVPHSPRRRLAQVTKAVLRTEEGNISNDFWHSEKQRREVNKSENTLS